MRMRGMYSLCGVLWISFLGILAAQVFAQGEYASGVNPRPGDRREFSPGKKQIKEHPGPGDFRDRSENLKDRSEDFRDRREDVKDRREDIQDRMEDVRDRRHNGGLRDRLEDIRDKKEDLRDRREDLKDRREDFRDRREDLREHRQDKPQDPGVYKGFDRGVRDHGAGIGAGKGQGGNNRSGGPAHPGAAGRGSVGRKI